MSFNILVRNPESEVAGLLERQFKELPYTLQHAEVDDYASPNSERLHAFIKEKSPNIAVNLLPDKSEQLFDERELIATKELTEACIHYNIPLIQVSSYTCFGESYSAEPIKENHPPTANSNDKYGQLFFQMEQIVAAQPQHMVLRLPWKVDFGDDCLFSSVIPNLIYGSPLSVSSYYRGASVGKAFLVQVLSTCIKQILCGAENWGTFNLSNSEHFSEAEFTDALSRLLEQEFNIEINKPVVYSHPSEKRLLSGSANLESQRLTDNFGILLPSWRAGFKNAARTWMKAHGFEIIEEQKLRS